MSFAYENVNNINEAILRSRRNLLQVVVHKIKKMLHKLKRPAKPTVVAQPSEEELQNHLNEALEAAAKARSTMRVILVSAADLDICMKNELVLSLHQEAQSQAPYY